MNDPSDEPMGQLSAHLDRGWDLVARGDFSGAMLSAEKSLELDEGSPEAHNLIGYIFQAEGRAEEALEHYRQALDLDESYVDAMLNAADLLMHPLNDLEGALEMVREAREWLEEDGSADELADTMLLEVDIHLFRGDRVAATSVVRDLPAGPFENPRITTAVGGALLDVGDTDAAMALLEQAVAEEPTSDAFYFLALGLEARGDKTGALLAFLQSRELDHQSDAPPWTIPLGQFERRVQSALTTLPAEVSSVIEGALVVVTDLPGAEVVAEGADPRTPVLLDAVSEPGQPDRVGRIFVYKRNIERIAPGLFDLDVEVARALANEVQAVFSADPEADAP
ncbi:MAG: tetratricopeptide repeat protein [Sandaracinaceae bacterium]|nr:tetratricopeptide repeat protein [Sandaracinaceae bacterium]